MESENERLQFKMNACNDDIQKLQLKIEKKV